MDFLKFLGFGFRGWHFLVSWGSDACPREPDAGLSSGALRAQAPTKVFLIFCSLFLSLGSRVFDIFLQFLNGSLICLCFSVVRHPEKELLVCVSRLAFYFQRITVKFQKYIVFNICLTKNLYEF